MSDELKPCPFCGGMAVLDGRSDDVRIRCIECKAAGAIFYFSPEDDDQIDAAEADAVKAWNERR